MTSDGLRPDSMVDLVQNLIIGALAQPTPTPESG